MTQSINRHISCDSSLYDHVVLDGEQIRGDGEQRKGDREQREGEWSDAKFFFEVCDQVLLLCLL